MLKANFIILSTAVLLTASVAGGAESAVEPATTPAATPAVAAPAPVFPAIAVPAATPTPTPAPTGVQTVPPKGRISGGTVSISDRDHALLFSTVEGVPHLKVTEKASGQVLYDGPNTPEALATLPAPIQEKVKKLNVNTGREGGGRQ